MSVYGATNVHPSSIQLIFFKLAGELEPIPADIGRKAEFNLDM